MRRASLWTAALGMFGLVSAAPAAAQDMMRHIDLTSPEMTSAEMTRADVEAVIAAATSAQRADFTGKKLSGLDLSGLDLSGAVLRAAETQQNQTHQCKARPSHTRSGLASGSRSQPSEPQRREHLCCTNAARKT